MAARVQGQGSGLRNECSLLLQGNQWKEKEQQDPLEEGQSEGLLPLEGSEARQKCGSLGSSVKGHHEETAAQVKLKPWHLHQRFLP